jgi:hypothetical protein
MPCGRLGGVVVHAIALMIVRRVLGVLGCGPTPSCGCRKPHPGSSGGMLVLVEETAQPVVSADDHLLDGSRIGDRIREQTQ